MVEYEYEAEQDDELTLKPGDIITEVKMLKGGWWEGTLNGKRGVFPDNFVKEIKKEVFKPDKRKVNKKAPPPQKNPEPDLNHSQAPPSDVGKRPSNSVKKKKRARVTYDYESTQDDELMLHVGEVVEITDDMVFEGWFQGVLDGKEGMFPSNFVEIMSDSEKDDEGKEVLIKGKKVKGIGLGMNIFEGGMPKLRATKKPESQGELSPPVAGSRPAQIVKKQPQITQKAAPPPVVPASEPKPVQKAKVLYAYEAENEDELSLEVGQVVVVLEKDSDDSGWWKGRVNGREGVFPDNFVEIIPSEESKPKKSGHGTLNKNLNIRPPPPEADRVDHKIDHKVDHKDDKNKREPQSYVGKRPGPPPLGKKPGKNADPKLMAQTDDHKAQEQQTDVVDQNPKLKHPTKERPKPPTTRQPSSGKLTAQKDVPSRVAPAHSNSVPETMTTTVPDNMSPPPLPQQQPPPVSPPLLQQVTHTGDIPRKPASAVGSGEIVELRKQIEELRENSVPRKQYDELKMQCNQLKSQVDQMKKTFDKRLYDVMVEVDEEKKQRIGLQVEVDRVKKLVTPVEP